MQGLDYRFLSDPGIPGVRSMGPSVAKSLNDVLLAYLMCLWLILADYTNRAIPGNLELQVRKSCLVRKSYLVKKVIM